MVNVDFLTFLKIKSIVREMNISDCSDKLLAWFRENKAVFTMKKSSEILDPIVEDTEERDAVVRGALDSLEEYKLIKKVTHENRDLWVLEKRIEAYKQTVELNETLCMAISNEINEFCDMINDHSDYCQSTDIKEKDIKNLLIMYSHFKNTLAKKEEEEENENDID